MGKTFQKYSEKIVNWVQDHQMGKDSFLALFYFVTSNECSGN